MKKQLLFKKGLKTLIASMAVALGLPVAIMAQATITDVNPVAGFPGDSIVVNGTEFTNIEAVKIGELAVGFRVVSDTEIKFAVPEAASSGQIILEAPQADPVSTSGSFLPLTPIVSTQELLFYETGEDLPAGGGGITGIEDHEAGNHFNNDDITFGGWGGMDYNVQAGQAEEMRFTYEGSSGGFSMQLWGQYATFIINGINTTGYESVRLSFGLGAWWYPGWLGGLLVQYQMAGDGDEWVTMTTVGKGISAFERINIPFNIPEGENINIRFMNLNEIDYASAFPPNIDDVMITGIPAGLAQISALDPTSVRLGKTITIKGSNLEDAKKVIFKGADDTEVEVTDITVTEGKQITCTVPQDAVEGRIAVVDSEDARFESIDILKISDSTPKITEFSPTSGPEGGMVYLIGTNLYNIESIAFNDVTATEIFYVNDTIAEVYIPEGAATGGVDITTTQGDFKTDDEILWDDDNDPDTPSINVALGEFTVDNTVPKLTFTLSVAEVDEGETVDLVAELSAAADQEVKLAVEVGGTNINSDDYTIAEDTLAITAGSTASAASVISILKDSDIFEEAEQLEVNMVGAIGPAVLGLPRMKSVEIALILGVRDELTQNEIIIYKSSEGLNIQLRNEGTLNNATAMIHDVNGRTLYLNKFKKINNKVTLSEANQFKPGIYIIRLANDQGEFVKKFILN